VVAGMLQGQERFIAFGLTRLVHALGRFAVAVILVSLGSGVLGAIAAFPIGSALALLAGLGFLGVAVWQPGPALSSRWLRDGLRLSAHAFLAYAAYMSLLNIDLIWVNRSFSGEMAGSYAIAVLLRRVLALMPGAAVVIMYPRVVAQVTQRRLPDRLIGQTAAVVLGSTLVLTVVYFTFGLAMVRWAFGEGYAAAGPLLGWMGLAMLGYGFGSVWMNLYLASRPAPFVLLLGVTVVLQVLLVARYHASLLQVAGVFMFGGWTLGLGGLALYFLWLRPRLL
jgi:O-antigen/teichoic acid export membrane protein